MTAPPIARFKRTFLSNFWPAKVTLDHVEAAYQAAKTLDREERAAIRAAPTPAMAKRLGRRVTLRPDWDQVKLGIMLDLLRQKFAHPDPRAKLLATGNAELVEGNNWFDTYWGTTKGRGENHLGRLLMQVRAEVAAEVAGH